MGAMREISGTHLRNANVNHEADTPQVSASAWGECGFRIKDFHREDWRVCFPLKAEGVSQLEGQGEDDLLGRSSLQDQRIEGEGQERQEDDRTPVSMNMIGGIYMTVPGFLYRCRMSVTTEYEINKLLLLMVTTMVRTDYYSHCMDD